MNKQELIAAVANASGLGKGDASRAVEAVFDTISASLKKGDEVRLVGFGTFAVSKRKAQPAHGRADDDQGVDPAQVQGREGFEGFSQLK